MNKNYIFKTIELPNYTIIVENITKTVTENSHLIPENSNYLRFDPSIFLNPNLHLKQWVNDNNLVVEDIAIIRTKPNNNTLPHIDAFPTQLLMIFPVSNCINTYTEIYELPAGLPPIIRRDSLGNEFYQAPFGLKVIGKYSLSTPVLLNTKNPHKIYNYTDSDRIAMTMRFKVDPWFLME